MNMLKHVQAASLAIDQLGTASGLAGSDRATQLSALRRQIDRHIERLAREAEADATLRFGQGRTPISQREGD